MAAPSTATLIDVIVLVFAKSEMRTLVGTDALKTVLDGEQREMFPEPGTMMLQPVYELLEGQPGFDPEKAVAPFCRLKTWEARLQIKVVMPNALEVLDQKTCEMRAINVNAFDSDLDKLLKPSRPTTPAPVARMIESSPVKAGPGTSSRRFKIAIAAAGIGLVAAGVSLYLTLGRGGGGNTQRLSSTELSELIPLEHVRKSGDIIMATLSDLAWLQKPEAERRKQLEEVVVKMRVHQARTLMLVDNKGVTVGSVVLKGAPVISFVPRKTK